MALVLLYFFFRGIDADRMVTVIRQANPWWLLAGALMTIVTFFFRAWRWAYLLAPLVRVPLGFLFTSTFIGFMGGLFIPRAGEVLRPYLVARRYSVSTSAAFASIIIERLVDLITVLILFSLYLYVLPMPEQQTRGALLQSLSHLGLVFAAGSVTALAVLLALNIYGEQAVRFFERFFAWLPAKLATLAGEMLRSFVSGLGVLRASPAHLLAILGQSFLVWLTIAFGIHWANRAFGIDLPLHSTFLMIGFLTVGVAVPTPGMVGGFHEAYMLALTQAFGVDKTTAVAAGIASHAVGNLPVLVLGLIFLGREGLSLGRVAEIAENKDEDKEEPR